MKFAWMVPALALAGLFAAPPAAQAQATRTWVSGVGDDANPCSRTAPCKTFAGAISKTAAFGSIDCLDPGGFGAVTITKSIAIVCPTTEGGVLVSGTNGVIVNVQSTDTVILDGLDIEGNTTGLAGVRMIGSGNLLIRRTGIRSFSQYGVDVEGTAGTVVTIEDSYIASNAMGGAKVLGAGGATNVLFLRNASFTRNGTVGVTLGAAAAMYTANSTIVGSPTAVDTSGGGTITSLGDNALLPPPTITTTIPPR